MKSSDSFFQFVICWGGRMVNVLLRRWNFRGFILNSHHRQQHSWKLSCLNVYINWFWKIHDPCLNQPLWLIQWLIPLHLQPHLTFPDLRLEEAQREKIYKSFGGLEDIVACTTKRIMRTCCFPSRQVLVSFQGKQTCAWWKHMRPTILWQFEGWIFEPPEFQSKVVKSSHLRGSMRTAQVHQCEQQQKVFHVQKLTLSENVACQQLAEHWNDAAMAWICRICVQSWIVKLEFSLICFQFQFVLFIGPLWRNNWSRFVPNHGTWQLDSYSPFFPNP